MQINTKLSNCNKEIYKNYSFWENQIINNTLLWEGYFEDKALTKDSKILYIGMLDVEKNIMHSSFVVYPSIYKLLGFLQHVYLPTGFFTWFERQANDFYIPLAPPLEVIDEITKNNTNVNPNDINSMIKFSSSLENAWLFNENELTNFIQSFSDEFNNCWNMEPTQKLFFKVFNSPSEIFDFVKDFIGWSDFNNFIEEEISMSLESFKFTCDNALNEPLLNKKFIDILNTNMPILI